MWGIDRGKPEHIGQALDVHFGPPAPEGLENNRVQTIPGKGWFAILRLYIPLQSWFEKTWRPGEIEQMQPDMHTEFRLRL